MKKIFLAMAGISAAPAHAADLPPYPAAPAVVVDPDCWTGFYVGANLGYHAGKDSISSSANPFGWGTAAAGIIDSRASSWLGSRGTAVGGQIGFNWQIRNVVFGWEADGSAAPRTVNSLTRTPLPLPTATSCIIPPPPTWWLHSARASA
jgi:outer membrane immunogenic protein